MTESLVWLVLEYCPGDELYNYLLKHGKLPVEKVQKTFTQLVGAVCYVHQQSCVHRDLKLENILLDKHENVKLCDFGFTREYEGKANYLQTFCGTICYSAPEMLKGEKYAGEKVDVWSLGVILYALLCGELPFDEDDDNATRAKILSEEPNYPDHIPPDALSLLKALLSKRPLLRPSLPEILAHPFLADHAPQQLEILKLQRPEPFSTPLEKETLHRMRCAGVNIDSVVESVLAQRCDALAGWWTLLIEKEERKQRRRERKRREREAENRNSRRFSQASSRLNALATVEEAQFVRLSDPPPPRTRGRSERRSGHYPGGLVIPDMPDLADLSKITNGNLSPDSEAPPPPVDKDSIRSVSSSRHRKPIPPPKEGVLRSARSRGSTLHLVTTSDALENNSNLPADDPKKVKKRPSHAIIATWKNWTHWLFENTRLNRHANKRGTQSAPNLLSKPGSAKDGKSKDDSPRPQTSKYSAGNPPSAAQTVSLPKGIVANGFTARSASASAAAAAAAAGGGASSGSSSQQPATSGLTTPPMPGHPPRLQTSSTSYKRHSLSPSPLTPRSSAVRRSSGPTGLRGRKSTSSSVSSVRSLHHAPQHHHSHSKASSTSSNGSVSTSVSKTPLQSSRSPHHSVKVLPATPTGSAAAGIGFPSNIRLVRDRAAPPLSLYNEGLPGHGPGAAGRMRMGPNPPGSPNPFAAGGVMFAKRKRNLFKGPMMSFAAHHGRDGAAAKSGGGGGGGSGSHSRSASASGLGRRSGEVTIQEVDEDEGDDEGTIMMGEGGAEGGEGEEEEEIEEVESFTPIVRGPGEVVEEKIFEEGEEVDEMLVTTGGGGDGGGGGGGGTTTGGLQPAAPIKPAG